MLEVGKKAPLFKLKNQNNDLISLSDFKGKKIILYFYPKDNTPGCTKEACSFRDNHTDILKENAVVLGISADSVKSHNGFSSKFNLPFFLLSDQNKEVINKYKVWKEKSLYGKKYMGIERTTFIIDEKGIIQTIFSRVKVDGHSEEISKELKK